MSTAERILQLEHELDMLPDGQHHDLDGCTRCDWVRTVAANRCHTVYGHGDDRDIVRAFGCPHLDL